MEALHIETFQSIPSWTLLRPTSQTDPPGIPLQERRERALHDANTLRPVTTDQTLQNAGAKTLNDLLLESIDDVLDNLLRRKTREAIYDYLARNYSVARDEIPGNMDKFFQLTEEAFGKGNRTIARCIVKRLFEKLEWKFENIQGFDFYDYLEFARARMARELVQKAKATALKGKHF
jgi:hypothetical protein